MAETMPVLDEIVDFSKMTKDEKKKNLLKRFYKDKLILFGTSR